jgi:magnesium-transporting ATPase (P-type)
MGKTNWMRVFLGGLLAGVVLIILGYVTLAIYLRNILDPAFAALGHPVKQTIGFQTFWIVFSLLSGIIAVWLYSAIRPRYGAGAKTAVIAGLAVWILQGLSYDAVSAAFGLFRSKAVVVDSITALVLTVVSTLLGAWVYKEQTQ